MLIVDGTLVPTRDHTVAEQSKIYRYSTNHQVVIDADTRLVVAVGRPVPGNRNDCKAWELPGAKDAVGHTTVIADGGYRGTGLVIPHLREPGQGELPAWKEEHNASHRKVRARVEHTFDRMQTLGVVALGCSRSSRVKGSSRRLVRREGTSGSGRSIRIRSCLLPPSLDDWLPEGHLARFVADLVDEVLDLSLVDDGLGVVSLDVGAVAVLHEEHQVITAADVTTNASDALNYTPMLDQSAHNTGTHPKQALVDAGYCSETNLEAARDRQLTCGTDTFMATGRLRHDEQVPPAPRGRIPKDATLKERMARKLRTKPGRAAYSRRKVIVEPVFGQIMTCQGGRQLLLRGEEGARSEWRLLAACHNLRKIFRHAGTAGLAAAVG